MINVFDFGDDLQLAMDTASQEHQQLYFPAGEWNVDEPLHIPDRGLRMCGESLVNLQQSVIYYYGSSGSLLRGVASEMPYGNFWGGIEICGLAFSQRGNSTDPLVYMQGMIFSSWERCRFLTRGHSSPGLTLDYSCTLNQFLHCDFEPENGVYGLVIQGFQNTSPTINRFSHCEFMSNGTASGILLHGTNTNYFESCCWEHLQTGVRLEPHTDPVLINSRYNMFIAPRLEDCAIPFDWSSTSDRNFVMGRYVSLCGEDQGERRWLVEWGNNNQLPKLDINGYTPNTDKMRVWGDGNGIGLYQDVELTNRLLAILNYQGKPRLKSKYGMVIESETPGSAVSKLTIDMPVTLIECADTAAPMGTLYFSTTQNALVFKDSNGIAHKLYL